VRLAYRFAIASDKITADGVEVTGFVAAVMHGGIVDEL